LQNNATTIQFLTRTSPARKGKKGNMTGLGKPELRDNKATCDMTASEYNWLKAHPDRVKEYSAEIQKKYVQQQQHEIASERAKRAVITKRKKYKLWPANRK
jgi:hypothetical protein